MRNSMLVLLLATAAALPAGADSLFSKAAAERGSLVSNKQLSFEVGDIVVVLVRENINATTQADTNTKKESELSAEAPVGANTFLVAKGPGGLNIVPKERLPNWDIEIENEHKGEGNTIRTNKFTTTIACTVKEVHENGNIDIEGSKKVTINREDSTVVVSGTVRGRDVSPENTVPSDKVANAVVELKGKGPLWNNQRRGLLTRLLDWFSPF